MKRILARTIGAALLTASLTVVANAQEIVLRLGDSLPATHLYTRLIALPWIDAVRQRTGGKVEVQHYPAEQLGKAKDMLTLTTSGVLDIGLVTPIYISDKLPLSGIFDLPGAPYTSCQGVEAFLSMATGDGILAKNDFGPNGIRVLMAAVHPPYQVFTANHPIPSLGGLKGLKVRTAGGAQELTTQRLGMVPVKISAPETAEALDRGTIDGAILAHASIGGYGLTDVIRYATEGANLGSAVITWSISERKFQSLPADIRNILVEEGLKATREGCKGIDQAVEDSVADWKAKGVEITVLGAEDQQTLVDLYTEIGSDWANALEKRGKPAPAVLEQFKSLVLQ